MADEQNVDQATHDLEEQVTAEKTYSQVDLERVGVKEHKSGYSKAVRDLGFEDIESAKSALNAYKEWQESQKTEAEKRNDELATKSKELDQALADKKLLQAQLTALTVGVKAESVEDVITLAQRSVNDEVTIEQAIQAVLTKYPHFGQTQEVVQEAPRPNITVGGNPKVSGTGSAVDPFQAVVEQYTKLKK